MGGSWATELWRLVLVTVVIGSVGALFGRPWLGVILGLVALLMFHVWHLRRLERWMSESGVSAEPPNISGIWAELYHYHYQLHRRHQTRQRQLSEALGRFNQSAQALPDATVVLGDKGEIEWFNDAAGRDLNLRRPRDVGQRIDNLIRFPNFVSFVHDEDYSERVEIPSPADEDRTLSIAIVPYGKSQKLLVAQDVTRLIALETMRRDFVANVSHELKTPLTVLAGYLETMRGSNDPALARWSRSFDLMEQQTHRMTSIVEDLLFLSRLEGKRMQMHKAVDVPELVNTIRIEAEALSRRAPKPHQISVEIDRSMWLNGDEAELHSAFANLVFNAVHYSPQGGRIVLRWQRAEDNTATFSVSDEGMGIPAGQIPRITERFYRVDESRSRQSGGTGLGLSIVKHVLALHHGELSIESRLAQGSTFTCTFPANQVVMRPPAPVIPINGQDQKRHTQ